MAKQVGPLFITGTIDGIIFYKLGETYYLRSKGAYKSGKQMRKDPTFKRTLERPPSLGWLLNWSGGCTTATCPEQQESTGFLASSPVWQT
ncbi:MAG TPA: hypothetical protein VD794_05250, partial [Flavisolibacter sp.]|nr:hypothetical protein [Flavisolibacter sp.]